MITASSDSTPDLQIRGKLAQVICGDASEVLRELELAGTTKFRCCITSPPYWRQRDYHHPKQIGQEPTPDVYIARLLVVFDGVYNLLHDDGTLWVVIGDSYAQKNYSSIGLGIKAKDLIGIPDWIGRSMRERGWFWRSTVIWNKSTIIPAVVRDRPVQSHEYVLMFTKRASNYLYRYDSVREPLAASSLRQIEKFNRDGASMEPSPHYQKVSENDRRAAARYGTGKFRGEASRGKLMNVRGRLRRSVWTVAPSKQGGGHLAVFPEELIRPCVEASSQPGDYVLDPFCGSGTTGVAAVSLGRQFLGIELNSQFVKMASVKLDNIQLGIF